MYKPGPNSNWPKFCPTCDNSLPANNRQSPIDLNSNLVKFRTKPLPKLTFTPNAEPTLGTYGNINGNTIQFTAHDPKLNTICGGPLSGEYNFAHVNCHWGKTNYNKEKNREPIKMTMRGSEHWIEGKQ